MGLIPFAPSDLEESSILKEAKELGKVMDLNIVRLKFTAYLQDSNGGFTRALKPVVSNAIYDSSESGTAAFDHRWLKQTATVWNLTRSGARTSRRAVLSFPSLFVLQNLRMRPT